MYEHHDAEDAPQASFSLGGGTALQCTAAARSGAKTSLIGSIGSDFMGQFVIDSLRRDGIPSAGLSRAKTPTGIISRIGQHSAYSIGANTDCSISQISDMALNERNIIVVQDDIAPDVLTALLARTKHTRVALCLSNEDSPLYTTPPKGIDLILSANPHHNKDDKTLYIQTPAPEHAQGPYHAYCGVYLACIQAGLERKQCEEYAATAASLSKSAADNAYNSIPYIGHIEDAINRKETA